VVLRIILDEIAVLNGKVNVVEDEAIRRCLLVSVIGDPDTVTANRVNDIPNIHVACLAGPTRDHPPRHDRSIAAKMIYMRSVLWQGVALAVVRRDTYPQMAALSGLANWSVWERRIRQVKNPPPRARERPALASLEAGDRVGLFS
jgi:hypothetical protein